jgi:glutaconate CoA-transferase subunit B
MGYDAVTKRMQVESLHPGVTAEDIRNNTGFEILFADDLSVTSEPTDEELQILRTQVDPLGLIIGK